MENILFEPFKIKVVEALPYSTEEQRKCWIEECFFNVFSLKSDQIIIDLLTDSGTGAMSDVQWGEMIKGDESYAGSRSFLELERVAKEIFTTPFILPVHQGRVAEHLLFSALLKQGELVLSNGLFDTTLANILDCGAEGINLPIEEAADPFFVAPFKGNISLTKLEETLRSKGDRIKFVLMTITNNTGGGQPVSLDNLKKVRELTKAFGKLLVIDGCRFAENAYFIKSREAGQSNRSVKEIAQECFSLCDAFTFSGKKDGLANIGGLLGVRDKALSDLIKDKMIHYEGFPTYGGLAGYSLAALHQGLKEVLDERYLQYRLRTVSWAIERLVKAGVPVIQPAGGHAVYVEGSRFFPHIPRDYFPGLALSTELFIKGGIRCCELGGVAFGTKDAQGKNVFPPFDLVRLAFPRRVYTEAHIGYVVQCLIGIFEQRAKITHGFDFLEEAPMPRHFRSKFKRVKV